MMQILIAERLRPFSHVPGSSTILPGSKYQVEVFPALIRIYDAEKSVPELMLEFPLNFKGEIRQFTVCNDLEKGRLTVSGFTAQGWMRYHLMSDDHGKGVRLSIEKAPLQSSHNNAVYDLFESASYLPYVVPRCDRLSLGNHKAQDIELIKRRSSLIEMLPLIHRLGQMVPVTCSQHSCAGTLALLEACSAGMVNERPEVQEENWSRFILGCFSSLLSPQLQDIYHQGLVDSFPFASDETSPLVILSEGSCLIRSLFVQYKEETLALLPHLLPSLHCGRMLDVPVEGVGRIGFEWTKKTIRRVILCAEQDKELQVDFRHIKSFRFRLSHNQGKEGRICNHSRLSLKQGTTYFFDNFQ